MEKITAAQDSAKVSETRSKFMTMILRRMTDNEARLTNADSVVTNLYLFHYPYLEQYPNTNAEIIKLESYTKKL
ncbi:hypothetical protein ABS768_01775 [Flavobacterium sp. ST-75]|uniref:Uncharacterized protein n=1 Tax=Flavobacterium rhizophilum TaxID=3163296 RepID=A0ABW8Y8T8_9FLAO